ncbi:MAG: DUF488 family protein [bacterium]|nr:DUF488 family protein [bacterium]
MIKVKRAYETPQGDDGFRILVDRLWPRGLSKGKAGVDLWLKDIAPSAETRRWFAHDPKKWSRFKRRYFRELTDKGELLALIESKAGEVHVTLLHGAKEQKFNNAVALREYLEGRISGKRRKGRKPPGN